MRRLSVAIGAASVCFATGAFLSILSGLESRTWVPAGVATSAMVASFAFRAGSKKDV